MTMTRLQSHLFPVFILALLLFTAIDHVAPVCCNSGGSAAPAAPTAATPTTTTTNSLPRSQQGSIPRTSNHRRRHSPFSSSLSSPSGTEPAPWNPSHRIDDEGFLDGLYQRVPGEWEAEVKLRTSYTTDQPARVRQVPGDGNCLFHSISLCLRHSCNGTHWNMRTSGAATLAQAEAEEAGAAAEDDLDDLDALYRHSRELRSKAVACLQQEKNQRLFLQGREHLRAEELVYAAAQQYGLSPSEYCEAMEQDSVWGGGPEIVALCNILKRPIHVYELAVAEPSRNSNNQDDDDGDSEKKSPLIPYHRTGRGGGGGGGFFVLRRMACFGSPRFDRTPALHILSADSRFPDVEPGLQLSSGNHFLAVFPEIDRTQSNLDRRRRRRRNRRLRGGDDTHGRAGVDGDDSDEDQRRCVADDKTPPRRSFLGRIFGSSNSGGRDQQPPNHGVDINRKVGDVDAMDPITKRQPRWMVWCRRILFL